MKKYFCFLAIIIALAMVSSGNIALAQTTPDCPGCQPGIFYPNKTLGNAIDGNIDLADFYPAKEGQFQLAAAKIWVPGNDGVFANGVKFQKGVARVQISRYGGLVDQKSFCDALEYARIKLRPVVRQYDKPDVNVLPGLTCNYQLFQK